MLIPFEGAAQLMVEKETFSRADSLRGGLTKWRSCYDVTYYHLDVKLDIGKRYLRGSNEFRFTATEDFSRLQIDLFANLTIEKIVYQDQSLRFNREFNAVFIDFPEAIKKGASGSFTVFYSGHPIVAKKAPWDGGFIFSTDPAGKPWVATAVQGLGASSWWPNKDHLADEPDSMLISIHVPRGLKNISNGRLRKITEDPDGYTRFDWFVGNPINNYSVAMNVGDYVHFSDAYRGEKGPLTLDYWVLPANLEKAKAHFPKNVNPMMKSFEYWFGPYPFYEDGYKLIETPYLGMEHQSAVAYGNGYQNGYLGKDLSGSGWGNKWDFIIIHETGHEWFGNNITCKDIADMWIHESFTSYSEGLYVESLFGKKAGQEYIAGTRTIIENKSPIIGQYGVNKEGSGDMYSKGSNILHTMRTIINNDGKWRAILRGLNKEFYHQTVTTEQVVKYMSDMAGMDLRPIFRQYLYFANVPKLEVKAIGNSVVARWKSDVKDFSMPVKIRRKGGEYRFVTLTSHADVPLKISGLTLQNIEVDTANFYIEVGD
ncbi:M1 family metallopeptidase [Arcticibacter sp.]|uniref:M1 family metallopeptidase n=1 Tax=Arcticibacter sp. TaxID=1872630 RepID=UPI00388DBCFB